MTGCSTITGLEIYFLVWTLCGMAAYPPGLAVAAIEMQQPAFARAVPLAVGVVVIIAGVGQLTRWKARHLACCRQLSGSGPVSGVSASYGEAWRRGVRFGIHCSQCCAPLTAILLVTGVMDLRAMAVVTAVITTERLAPAGERVARAIGAVAIGAGSLLIAQAAGVWSVL
jgi:predicted metal-binding membrane protein